LIRSIATWPITRRGYKFLSYLTASLPPTTTRIPPYPQKWLPSALFISQKKPLPPPRYPMSSLAPLPKLILISLQDQSPCSARRSQVRHPHGLCSLRVQQEARIHPQVPPWKGPSLGDSRRILVDGIFRRSPIQLSEPALVNIRSIPPVRRDRFFPR